MMAPDADRVHGFTNASRAVAISMMAIAARFFLCALCRRPALISSRRDRGQFPAPETVASRPARCGVGRRRGAERLLQPRRAKPTISRPSKDSDAPRFTRAASRCFCARGLGGGAGRTPPGRRIGGLERRAHPHGPGRRDVWASLRPHVLTADAAQTPFADGLKIQDFRLRVHAWRPAREILLC